MDEEVAAVALDFAPFAVASMWAETALSRAEKQIDESDPESYHQIVDHPEDYGMAVEYRARGVNVGQYGYDTDYELQAHVDEHVIEQGEADAEIAEQLAEAWVTHLANVVGEAQESTTLSAREFATLIMMNNEMCDENRAADALSVTKGTYRGKKGRIKQKRNECEESAIFDRLTQMPESAYNRRDRTLGERSERDSVVTPSEMYDTQAREEEGKLSGWNLQRETAHERDHDTYEQANWRTAHVKGVDRSFVADTSKSDSDSIIRLDIDGVGSGGADMHRVGENVQASLWIGQPQATILFRQLAEALLGSGTFDEEAVSNDDELVEWVRKHAVTGNKVQIIDPDTAEFKPVAQAELEH